MSQDLSFPIGSMFVRESSRRYRQATAAEVLEAAREAIEKHFTRGIKMTDPAATRRYLCATMAMLERETFRVLLLDSQHQLLAAVDVSVGTLDAAAVYPREVVKLGLQHNAAAAIFAHQHPSGIPEPSSADRLLTERLKQALALVDVRVLDHFVIGGNSVTSFAERGWI